VMRFQVAPNDLDVVQFGGVFGRPFDGEPVGALGQCRLAGLADVDRSVVEDEDDRLVRCKCAMKSTLRLVREAVTISLRRP